MMLINRSLSIMIHSGAKNGKTTLANTAPAPRLILDIENGSGTKFLPGPLCYWDPIADAPPAMDGDCSTCIVKVSSYDTVMRVYQWLASGQHPFRSVAIDSLTEVQRQWKWGNRGLETLSQQDWGAVLGHMERLIRDYRNLTEHPTNPLACVVFIAETRETNGRWAPYVQGQLAIELPYLCDVLGYLFVDNVDDGSGIMRPVRRLLVSPHASYEAGERVQGRLGAVVENPNLTQMIETIYPEPALAAPTSNGGNE